MQSNVIKHNSGSDDDDDDDDDDDVVDPEVGAPRPRGSGDL